MGYKFPNLVTSSSVMFKLGSTPAIHIDEVSNMIFLSLSQGTENQRRKPLRNEAKEVRMYV